MQSYTINLYLETALHVSGGTSTHHQERIQLYLQHLVFVTPSLPAGTSRQRHTCVIPEAVIQFKCSWWWAKISLETCRAAKE